MPTNAPSPPVLEILLDESPHDVIQLAPSPLPLRPSEDLLGKGLELVVLAENDGPQVFVDVEVIAVLRSYSVVPRHVATGIPRIQTTSQKIGKKFCAPCNTLK